MEFTLVTLKSLNEKRKENPLYHTVPGEKTQLSVIWWYILFTLSFKTSCSIENYNTADNLKLKLCIA